MARIDRRLSPRPLCAQEVLTVAEAARELKLRDSDARSWLSEHGLIVLVAGRKRVVWRHVLEVLDRQRTPTAWSAAKGVMQTDRFG